MVHGPAALELAYRSVFERAADALRAADIPVMPLKGILFAYWIYDDPAERLKGDIDLLVPPRDFERALAALAAARFILRPFHRNRSERSAAFPGGTFEIDLHRALFAPGRYRLPTAGLFARGTPDRSTLPRPVILPDPYDAYAHLVGHEASAHFPNVQDRIRGDLARLAVRFSLDPARCAARLENSGLARAARYTLGMIRNADPFARKVLAGLRPDPLGETLARLARATARRCSPMHPAARVAGHLTNASIPQAARAAMQALVAEIPQPLV